MLCDAGRKLPNYVMHLHLQRRYCVNTKIACRVHIEEFCLMHKIKKWKIASHTSMVQHSDYQVLPHHLSLHVLFVECFLHCFVCFVLHYFASSIVAVVFGDERGQNEHLPVKCPEKGTSFINGIPRQIVNLNWCQRDLSPNAPTNTKHISIYHEER